MTAIIAGVGRGFVLHLSVTVLVVVMGSNRRCGVINCFDLMWVGDEVRLAAMWYVRAAFAAVLLLSSSFLVDAVVSMPQCAFGTLHMSKY